MEDYDFKKEEKKILDFWEKQKIYCFNEKSNKKIFSIDTPPPTLSGEMHMGHASQYSQTDFIVRFKRMNGFNVFYPFGTDDNGLPTERLVEKRLKIKSKEMSRKEFIDICLNFLKKEISVFIKGWKDMGISCDWKNFYSTIDENSRKTSQWSFIDLYKKNRVERRDAPAMWCPDCQTGVAQVEVEDKEIPSEFLDVKLNVDGKDLIISTTRPELFPASVAVFYNPEDKRYKNLKGKKAKIPLFNIEVPILEDKRVNPEKGTGVAYCATFGDQTDMEWQKIYNFPIKEAVGKDGKMTSISGKYSGMNVKDARRKIIEDLKEKGFLIKQKKIKHYVNVHERCGTEIEFVKTKQWFVKYLDLKKDLLKWGNELNWHPKYMKHRYDNWVKGLQWDWLISNQRHFGVSFPVWYCENCNEIIIADEKQLPVNPFQDKPLSTKCLKCGGKEFLPEKDVLNTWFTSSMTPQIAINLIKSKTNKKLFPMDIRPQSHDIISFWLFNTLLKSRLHFKKNPWKDIIISGFVTLEGEKMSKSKGNVVSPKELIENYGADTIRYWAASSKLGEDFNYQEKDIITGKRFVKKLFNASRFVFMNLENYSGEKPKKFQEIDNLFLLKLNNLIFNVTKSFENYDYLKAKNELELFFWNDFCDNYLEIVKWRVYNGNENEKISAYYTLYNTLFCILKLFSPITPFITEHIYQKYFRKNEKEKSIHLSEWPKSNLNKNNGFKKLDVFFEFLKKVRQEKTKNKKPMNSECVVFLEKKDIKLLEGVEKDFMNVINSKEIKQGIFKVDFI